MKLRAIVLLGFTVASVFGQQTAHSKPLPNDPKALVQSLYTQVVARHPYGILSEAGEKRTFNPYLSKSLLHKFDLADACSRDWFRQNRGRAV